MANRISSDHQNPPLAKSDQLSAFSKQPSTAINESLENDVVTHVSIFVMIDLGQFNRVTALARCVKIQSVFSHAVIEER
jgi:hypothetical protein